ncbi:MAG TPA: hypothetical protein VFI31_15315, partial [Pirellulales bacterium]|nr:hypothetical protein [Pirellulales bacterium]
MRFVRLRYWPLWLGCALLLALAVWVRPRRIDGLATLDGEHRWWVNHSAPPRQFAWLPGEELSGLLPPRDPPDEISHPCLADDGRTLYITVRRAGGDADIYRSQWFDGRWQPAVAVTELNTPWDEVGVSVNGDGRQLYLASDRRGGKGGYDLYVALRRASGWGVPKNLGATVNTAADELEPAITVDGSQLYFSSDRTDKQSDLFVAQHAGKGGGWADAQPVQRANTAANERSPCLGEGGTVLYFSSDRPAPGRDGNFDLYRMLLRDAEAPVESLGQGVNTPADETSPAVSADGFGLTFVRQVADRPPGVYQSRLAEVKTIWVWDNSRWLALRAVWWKALLATG